MDRVIRDNDLILSENGVEILSISEEQKDMVALIKLNGSLRSDTVHDFQDEIAALVTLGIAVHIEFSMVSYISSACMQALLTIQQKIDSMGRGSMTLYKLPATLMSEFEKTGLADLLDISE